MVKERLKNPLFVSALISVLVIYTGVFGICKVPVKNRLQSVIPKSKIDCVSGVICSSPAKISSGKYYSANMKVCSVSSGKKDAQNLWGSATGIINVYIPSEIVESLFPGKLYSKSKQNEIIESGTRLDLYGNFANGEDGADSADRFFSSSVKNYGFVEVENCGVLENIFQKIRRVRALGRLQFKRLMYSWKDAGGLLLALLSGSREYTEPTVSKAFKDAGLSHVLALSGMHLGMISGIAIYFAAKIGRKKITYILQVFSVCLFVWFAGFSPSLLRAFICSLVILIQRITNVDEIDMVYVLCFSFIAQTVISPNDLQNIGFILSYGALIGILLSSDFFTYLYSKIIPRRVALNLAASTGAQAATLPISAKVFGRVTPIGIISAVFVSPLVTVFIYSGLALIILCLIFPSLVELSGIFMKIQYTLIRNMVIFFSKFPAINF